MALYESLQQVSAAYLIPLMPFNTICLANNYKGLFPPVLGTATYAECSTATLEVLLPILPMSNSEVLANISAVVSASCNGYDLLWRVMELFIPGFDTTVPIAQPLWHRNTDILKFSQSHTLYFRLQAKKNMYFSPCDCTNIFLRAAAPSKYADVVTTLQMSGDAYCNPDNNGYLPDHLQIDGIAAMINNNMKHCVRDLGNPRINWVNGANNTWDPAYSADDNDYNDPVNYPFWHVQGYCPRAYHLERGRNGATSGRGVDHCGPDGRRSFDCCGFDWRNTDPPKGHFAHPDQNHWPYKANVQCDACKRIGLKAAT